MNDNKQITGQSRPVATQHPERVDRPMLFIDGAWRAPVEGGVIEVLSPATEEVVGTIGEASPTDIDAAVAAARASFERGDWRRTPPEERGALLHRVADMMERRSEELAAILTAELGCPHKFSRTVHVPGPVRHLRYYGDYVARHGWQEERTDGVNKSLVLSEPVGVAAAISPWNGPLSQPVIKTAAALAAGCSIVVKPAPDAPLSTIALADMFADAGLPAGVFNLVPAYAPAAEHLVRHPDVDKVAFTGSTAVGKRIMALCSERVARVTLELGGKSAAILLDDADVELIASRLPPMLLGVNGQLCIAQSRVLVPRSRSRAFTEALCAAMARAVVGDPFDPRTDVGPLVSAAQRERVEAYIRGACEEGATAAVGGGRPSHLNRGFYVEPTVFTGVTPGMRIAREEVFGPVMSIIEYDDEEHAVAIANDSVYGLSGSVWSEDVPRAIGVAKRIRTGMVSINGRPQAWGTPFGGFKQSGLGREMGPEGMKSYLELKSISLP